jgi:hypothetical protein
MGSFTLEYLGKKMLPISRGARKLKGTLDAEVQISDPEDDSDTARLEGGLDLVTGQKTLLQRRKHAGKDWLLLCPCTVAMG